MSKKRITINALREMYTQDIYYLFFCTACYESFGFDPWSYYENGYPRAFYQVYKNLK